jgi:Mg-chelatase subunit ChlD/HAMP domain-containing protein
MMIKLLRRTCLKPSYSLRYQLWVSFGSISTIAIIVIICTSIAVSVRAGHRIQSNAEVTLGEQVTRTVGLSSAVIADTLSRRTETLSGAVSLLAEATRDRIVGQAWETDEQVPFEDMHSNTSQRKYPLAPVELPPDWNITHNVNDQNYKEHIQGERLWSPNMQISTKHAAYRLQGQCDPMAAEGDKTYYPNCTDANNDIRTGGVVQPVVSRLYEKVGFLQYFMKPLYEAHHGIQILGVYFFNDGAGASVVYPPAVIDGTSSYISIGCDWMLNSTNPHTDRPYATAEQAARCHRMGERVPAREYNPLERGWCRDQALAGGLSVITGPYLDAFQKDLWLITFGRAVFDRITGDFIACTLVDTPTDRVTESLSKLALGNSTMALARWSDGEFIAVSGIIFKRPSESTSFSVLTKGFSEEEFAELKSRIYPHIEEESERESRHILTSEDGNIIAAYAIPTPPEEYDPTYKPQLIVLSITSKDIFNSIDDMEDAIREDIFRLVCISAGLGAFGLVLVLCLTWLVSRCLTRPLHWMEAVSKRIIYSEGDINAEDKPLMKWSPKTEITSLVQGFGKMIQSSSGDGPAQVAQDTIYEITNTLERTKEFDQLYCSEEDGQGAVIHELHEMDEPMPRDVAIGSRLIKNFRAPFKLAAEEFADTDSSACGESKKGQYKLERPVSVVTRRDSCRSQNRICRIHCGRNLRSVDEVDDKQVELQKSVTRSPAIRRSPLFWWIVFLIVIPLLLTVFAITYIVSTTILRTLPDLVDSAKEKSLLLEKEHVEVVTQTKAQFAGEVLLETVRDLHLYKRFAEWLLLDVIERSDSITLLREGTEECKVFADDLSCPFFLDRDRNPCDCEWNDFWSNFEEFQCQEYEENPRDLQRVFWACQRNDADILTGDRDSIRRPLVDTSPENTRWWDNLSEVPGAEKGSNASGYETTYDRVRVLSALSVVGFPIQNYGERPSERTKIIGTFIGLESDGMLTGYAGCDHFFGRFSHFQSTKENGAAAIRGDLCPLGKYGFDSRCRGWYADGKERGETHITAPYVFAGTKLIATSITAPIYDPIREKYVGQALLDFSQDALLKKLSNTMVGAEGKGFAVVITPSSGIFGGDTVIGPKYSLGESAPSVKDVVLPYDDEESDFRKKFGDIVDRMKTGETGSDVFTRTLEGGEEESLYLTFAPVYVRTVETVNGSDFSRGVTETDSIVYSLAMVVPEDDLTSAFDYNFEGDLWKLITIFLVISTITSMIAAIVTSMVAIEITKPVMILCSIVDSINEGDIQDDIPPMSGGSREVNQVYNSFAKLYKIVRFSNTAFFSGNIEWALKFLTDALKLYRNVDDKKAIGVALNNLGNTYLSMYLARRNSRSCCTANEKCVKVAAHECYCEAVDMATEDYENVVNNESVDDKARGEYAGQLANRYFNRGIFLMLTEDDPCSPDEWHEMARQDLESAATLDIDVRNFWIRTRQVKSNSESYFERLVRRGAGLVSSLEGRSVDVEELLHEADSLLCSIGKDDQAPLIQTMSLSGRLQQLEEVAIRNELKRGNVEDAARFAVRMLIEDEFLIESAFSAAAEAILQSMKSCDHINWNPHTIETIKDRFRHMLKACKSTVSLPSMEKNIIFSLDANLSIDEERLETIKEGVVGLYNKVCHDQDQIGLVIFAGAVDEELSFDLTKKSTITASRLANRLHNATKHGGVSPLSHGFLRALDMAETSQTETWLVLVTDCQSWSDRQEWNSVQAACLAMSREQPVHLLVVGIDLSESVTSNLRSICRPRNSALIETSGDVQSISEAFAEVATMIEGSVMLRGFTMEKF